MNDKDIDKLIREALSNEQELPEGLSGRLERHINQLAADEQHSSSRKTGRNLSRSTYRRSLYWFGGMAATLLIGIAIFFQLGSQPVHPVRTDTFNDPEEAALVAQNALALLSTQLNKGLEQVTEVQEEVNRVNIIINKQMGVLSTSQAQ